MYSVKVDEKEYLAGKARIEEVDASFKDLGAVCDNIRYKKVSDALALLEKASKGEVPIRYYKHNKKLGHRKELQGKKGRYPKKAASVVLAVLKNAVANALQKGASEESLVIKHAAANKKRTYYRVQPKGRRLRHDYELARVEIIVVQKMSDELRKKLEAQAKKAEEKKEQPKQKKAEGAKEAKPEQEVPKAAKEGPKKSEKEKPKETAKKKPTTAKKASEKKTPKASKATKKSAKAPKEGDE